MMRVRRAMWWTRRAAACLVIGGAACWMGRQAAQAAPGPAVLPAQAQAPRAMQADLRIRQMQVAADGTPLGVAAPGVVLHVDRHLQGGHWRLTMTMAGMEGARVTTPKGAVVLENPFLVSRMEYDEDAGGEPVLYDRAGRRVAIPGDAERLRLGVAASLRRTSWDKDVLAGQVAGAPPPAGGRAITTGLIADARLAPARRQRLEARYGRAVGRVRGLDRFMMTAGNQTEEVLVAPDSSLPVEVNMARAGGLASHIQVTYDRNPAAGFVRRLLHSEAVSNEATGSRLVTEVETANLVLSGGAQ